MNKGIIYLIQPCELIGTSRYKIGCSKTPDLDRCKNGYKKGSRYICIMECIDPILLETNIKEQFNKTFILIAGNEYYEGNETDMHKLFIDIFFNHKNSINDTENINNMDNNYLKSYEENDEIKEIKNEFNNWNDDEEFGGKKKLLKIFIYNDYKNVKILYINEKKICNKIINKDYMEEFINKLIKYQIIQHEKIYDFNNKIFINQLNKYKNKINNVILSYENIYTNEMTNDITSNINYYFDNNYIINNTCCSKISDNHFIFDNNNFLYIQKINNEYYDIKYLRRYIPYCIEINKKDEFYLLNRDYEYIGIIKNNDTSNNFIKTNPSLEQADGWIRIYLFNDGSKPWEMDNNTNFKKLVTKYKELTINKKCLNLTKDTEYILNIVVKNDTNHLYDIPIIAKFLEYELKKNNSKQSVVKYTSLYELFIKFMKINNIKYEYTSTKFGLDIKEYKGIEKRKTNKGIEYIFNFPIIKEYLIEKKYIENN
jgi:hypothetical protein